MVRFVAVFLACCAATAGCRRELRPPAGKAAAPPSSAVPSGATAAAGQKPSPPLTLRGSAVALTPDETTLVVADEDHEALFLVPASFADTHAARVVPLPGPPAQVVALDERVFVTIRTVPAAAARAARDTIRGKVPTQASIALSTGEPWAAGVPSALAAIEAAEPPPSKPKDPARAAKAAASRVRRAERRANEEYSRKRPRNTPPAPFDPNVVRQSQGGLLLALRRDAAAGLVELGRVTLPPDAWGLSLTADGKRALVTSAWSARVTLVELSELRVLASAPTRREPRGIALSPDGKTAYVSHLVGSTLTEVALAEASLELKELPLPVAPARAPLGATLEASLGYDLVLSPDAQTLFAPRHALGAEGVGSWWGAPAVDALDLASRQPLAPAHVAQLGARLAGEQIRPSADWEASPGQAPAPRLELVQPRSVVYRKTRDTLLVASEGANTLTEVDALAPDPALAVVNVFELASSYDVYGDFADRGGGPAGVALSRDERYAYVYCRTTFDLARVELDTKARTLVHLADDGLPADAAYGRRLFADARSTRLSGGLGCAACHPEGRDDGYVWREGDAGAAGPELHFLGRRENLKMRGPFGGDPRPRPALFPRQTPMLAGRTRALGPFGWHAESKDITERLMLGSGLHRAGWEGSGITREQGEDIAKLDYLADYLRSGLVPPPTLVKALDASELRGKAIFESDQARCSRCHVPASEFTDRTASPLPPLPQRPGFDVEPNPSFKTPSLWFVAGTAPYFHDGSQATLEALVRTNRDRMGQTSHLDPDAQADLVAYLRTL